METHHRIANSLQLVLTFLALQERETADDSVKRILKAASSRIAAIGQVQRALLCGGGYSVDIGSFLESLCADVQTLTGLRISTQLADIELDAKQAQHVGIAINELLLNAAQHPPDGAEPDPGEKIAVTCELEDGFVIATVSDRARRLPKVFRPGADASVGAIVLRSAIQQLGGQLTFPSADGATARLRFPIDQQGLDVI